MQTGTGKAMVAQQNSGGSHHDALPADRGNAICTQWSLAKARGGEIFDSTKHARRCCSVVQCLGSRPASTSCWLGHTRTCGTSGTSRTYMRLLSQQVAPPLYPNPRDERGGGVGTVGARVGAGCTCPSTSPIMMLEMGMTRAGHSRAGLHGHGLRVRPGPAARLGRLRAFRPGG